MLIALVMHMYNIQILHYRRLIEERGIELLLCSQTIGCKQLSAFPPGRHSRHANEETEIEEEDDNPETSLFENVFRNDLSDSA